jgi:hypothetical protein
MKRTARLRTQATILRTVASTLDIPGASEQLLAVARLCEELAKPIAKEPLAGTDFSHLKEENVFEIEFVAVRGGSEPEVVEKMASAAARLIDADKTAKLLLEKVRQKRRTMPPDGYQIRTDDGRVVLRFLAR